jgi:hypothetical protein
MTNLEMLVRSHQARTMPQIDWSKRKEKWLHELGVLLQDIRNRLVDAGVPAAQIRSVSYTIRSCRQIDEVPRRVRWDEPHRVCGIFIRIQNTVGSMVP